MPILGALLMGVFSAIFEYLAKKLTVNLALAAAFLASATAAYLALKLAVFGAGSVLHAVMPSAMVYAFNLVLPSDIPAILTTIWVADTIMSGWGWWQQRIQILYQLGKS